METKEDRQRIAQRLRDYYSIKNMMIELGDLYGEKYVSLDLFFKEITAILAVKNERYKKSLDNVTLTIYEKSSMLYQYITYDDIEIICKTWEKYFCKIVTMPVD